MRIHHFCLVGLGLLFAGTLRGEDWPQWRGPLRTGHTRVGARVPIALAPELKSVWRLKVGEGFASPVVAGGKVFYFDNSAGKETLHAIDAADHRELWRATVDEVFHDEQGPDGPRCTPLVDGEFVFAQSGKGELQCLRVEDGQLVWRVNFLQDFGAAFLGEDSKIPGAAEHGYTASPVVDGERLIACVGGTNNDGIICFAKRTGKVMWKSQDDRAAYAAPLVATLAGVKQAVCFTVNGLVGLDLADGKLLWRVPIKTAYGRNASTPVIADDWVVAGSYQAGLLGAKIVLAGPDMKVGTLWTNKSAAINFSSPIAVGGYLYGLGPAKNLICVEIATGRLAWSKDGYFNSSPNTPHAAFLGLGENILVSTDVGELVLIAADPSGFHALGRAQASGFNWCNPAYADGRLYIRDGLKSTGNLYCLELLP